MPVRLTVLLAFLFIAASWAVAEESADQGAAAGPPPVPKGVEVLARGPVHEAFATPTSEPTPTKAVPKAPPKALDELPPDQKPEGDTTWIGGYWAWDDERNDFLWVSGIWRTAPPGKRWVAGYWRDERGQWQWVPGFWTGTAPQQAQAPAEGKQDVTYLPQPPAPPEVAAPGQSPSADTFYVPGHWVWRGNVYAWQAGYWARVQPGYVWVPSHYRWTPGGYIFVAGYWDFAVARRGVLYAPVVVDAAVVGPAYVYTPAYVVRDTLVLDALFIRPSHCHYYFGDYYSVRYQELGFESCVAYSRHHYDSLIVYEHWEHRADPAWLTVQIDLSSRRYAGQAPVPPRTLVQQNTIIQQNITNVTNVTNVTNNNTQVLVPQTQLAAAKGVRTVPVDTTTRLAAKQQAQAVQQVAVQRSQAEVKPPPGQPIQPRVASLNVPPPQPVKPAGTMLKAASSAPVTTAAPGTAARSASPQMTPPAAPLTKAASPAGNATTVVQPTMPNVPAATPAPPVVTTPPTAQPKGPSTTNAPTPSPPPAGTKPATTPPVTTPAPRIAPAPPPARPAPARPQPAPAKAPQKQRPPAKDPP